MFSLNIQRSRLFVALVYINWMCINCNSYKGKLNAVKSGIQMTFRALVHLTLKATGQTEPFPKVVKFYFQSISRIFLYHGKYFHTMAGILDETMEIGFTKLFLYTLVSFS